MGVDVGEPASSALDALARAGQALERASAMDESLLPARAQVKEAAALLTDVAAVLAEYVSSIDADPGRQAWVEERRAAIAGLRRRYGRSVAEVLEWLDHARSVVSEVGGDDLRLQELTIEEGRARGLLQTAGEALTATRVRAADALGSLVTVELGELAMPDAVLQIRVETETDLEQWTQVGADRVEFDLRPHHGGQFRPLARSASGGELSRVMLAIEVVLAGADPVATFVFDEVDAGIGGRAAVEVGRRLARLARNAQVIVVTHLPQVAAFADAQVVVSKDSAGLVTQAQVGTVHGVERVAELVRMLSGLDGSQAGQAHAEELLALAAADREGGPVRGESRVRATRTR